MKYRVLVVDDERIERVALETLIDWPSIGLELAGAARNGIEALELMRDTLPDIVVTDIKMPGMDGITLICEALALYPDLRFVVLSGHGDYEFTSRAMELGVRYYVLKPMDSGKILSVTKKAVEELRESRRQMELSLRRDQTIEELLPGAKREFFLRSLFDSGVSEPEWARYVGLGKEDYPLALLTVKLYGEVPDQLRALAETEALSLFAADRSVLEAMDRDGFYFFLRRFSFADIQSAGRRLRSRVIELGGRDAAFAASTLQGFAGLREARLRNERLLLLQDPNVRDSLIMGEEDTIDPVILGKLADFSAWDRVTDLESLYRFAAALCARMDALNCGDAARSAVISALLRRAGNQSLTPPSHPDRGAAFAVLESIFRPPAGTDDESRLPGILRGIFLFLPDPCLSVRMIAAEIAFMNEDYFARFFLKAAGIRIKEYILRERMTVAAEIIKAAPDIATTRLAVLSGFSEDGQYFSKLFKSFFGKTPAEYRGLIP